MNRSVPGDASGPRRGELALAFQEVLTITVRLRRGESPTSDSGYFRKHVKGLLADADEHARGAGYHGSYAKLATYAAIAFLDESVLEGDRPLFPDWAGRPLQEEVFGDNVAGENFYANLEDLLATRDSEELADVLEVYLLCLLLGFRGMYSSRTRDDLANLVHRVQRSIERIRGDGDALAPAWNPPENEVVPRRRDARTRTLGRVAAFVIVVVVALYAVYWFRLSQAVDAVALDSPDSAVEVVA